MIRSCVSNRRASVRQPDVSASHAERPLFRRRPDTSCSRSSLLMQVPALELGGIPSKETAGGECDLGAARTVGEGSEARNLVIGLGPGTYEDQFAGLKEHDEMIAGQSHGAAAEAGLGPGCFLRLEVDAAEGGA